MFDIGFQELVIIFVVALIVFGPKRLPEIGKTLGKGIGELKKAMDNVRDQIHEEVKDIKPAVDPIEFKNKLYSAFDDPPTKESSETQDEAKQQNNQGDVGKNQKGDSTSP